jgi:hypothetical protein
LDKGPKELLQTISLKNLPLPTGRQAHPSLSKRGIKTVFLIVFMSWELHE